MTDPSSLATPSHSNTDSLNTLRDRLNQKVLGQKNTIDLALTTLLAGGHLLIEDVPGVGKTTLARELASAFDGAFQRIQFTSDLLPMDVIGVQVYKPSKESFEFFPGPIFSNFLLADEINRAAPKTQSSLLEAMSEMTVSVERTTHSLPSPFMVIATQNPVHFEGTHPLPESQLDRFMMTITMGYPTRAFERQLLERLELTRSMAGGLMSIATLRKLQASVNDVTCNEAVLDYLQDIIEASRNGDYFSLGASTRAAITLLRAARAYALLQGRDFVTPSDVKSLVVPCLAHRVTPKTILTNRGETREMARTALRALLKTLQVPT